MPEPTDSLVFDDNSRRELRDRLSRVEGQLRGVGRMLDAQRPAPEVLQQLASIRAAVKGLTKVVLRHYLEQRAKEVLLSNEPADLDDLVENLLRFVKD